MTASAFGRVTNLTGERAPRFARRRRFHELHNDLAGDEPFDFAYSGSSMLVTVKLTRWDEFILLAAENVGLAKGGDTGGVEALGDIGTLMVTEGQALQLWLRYNYAPAGLAPKAAYTTLRNGWHFLRAWLETDDHDGGTDPASKSLTWRCARYHNPFTGAFAYYDRDMSGLPVPT